MRAESSAAIIGEIIEMDDAANRNNLTAIPRNRTLFYEKILGFYNHCNFICIDVSGFGDRQFYSIDTSHFNQEITNDTNTHEKLTKLKRSIVNLHKRNNNKFNIHDESKNDE